MEEKTLGGESVVSTTRGASGRSRRHDVEEKIDVLTNETPDRGKSGASREEKPVRVVADRTGSSVNGVDGARSVNETGS